MSLVIEQVQLHMLTDGLVCLGGKYFLVFGDMAYGALLVLDLCTLLALFMRWWRYLHKAATLGADVDWKMKKIFGR
jgi:hypothetical protein